MERVFGTLQNRLPQELRLAGIDTVEDARGMAHGNVNPQLIAANVMLDLARRLS